MSSNELRARFAVLTQLIALLLAACDAEQKAVSGDGACRDYTTENVAALSSKTDLASARTMRDWLVECDLSMTHVDEALNWAKLAADQGDSEDKRVYQGMLEAMNKPKS